MRNIVSHVELSRNVSPLHWVYVGLDFTNSDWYERLKPPCFAADPCLDYLTIQEQDGFVKLEAALFQNGLTQSRCLDCTLQFEARNGQSFQWCYSCFRCNESHVVLSIRQLPSSIVQVPKASSEVSRKNTKDRQTDCIGWPETSIETYASQDQHLLKQIFPLVLNFHG